MERLKALLEWDMHEIPKSATNGDCFQAAGRLVAFDNPKENIVLVHGLVKGQGPLEGRKFWHAWGEDGNTVIDKSNGRNIKMDKGLYYALGHIHNESGKMYRYTKEQAQVKMLKTETWGPWEGQK
jgi:hypothetical protein